MYVLLTLKMSITKLKRHYSETIDRHTERIDKSPNGVGNPKDSES
jgi:hypothetical protein